MQKLFQAVIGLGSAVFFIGALVFVLGQALFLVIGQPELIIAVKKYVSAVIFPTIAVTGVLCYLYSMIWRKPKSGADG